jgi:hypothetical protein
VNFIMSEKAISILWGISFWSLLSYLWIDWETLSIFAVVLFLDFFFWIIDVYLFDKSLITSKKAWRWLLNKITKLLLPMIVVIVLKWVWFKEMDFLISSIMWIMIVSEWYSIIWHLYSINTWKQLPEIDAFELLISKILSIFKKVIDAFLDDIDKEKSK